MFGHVSAERLAAVLLFLWWLCGCCFPHTIDNVLITSWHFYCLFEQLA